MTVCLEQRVVVADHDQPALVRLQELPQPHDRVGVEVVGRLVEQQRLGAGEQDPGQLDPAPLAAGERLQRLAEDPLLDAEAAGDLGGLRLGGVARRRRAARCRRACSAASPARARAVSSLPISSSDLAQPAYDVVEPARGQDPVAGERPRGRRCAGPAGGSRPRRWRGPCRTAGRASPARILVSVVLPAPLRPTRPTLSPAATRKLTLSIRRRAPARTSRCWAVIMRRG